MTIDERRRVLVRTILDDPDDDEARLIYADYLQQQGDPRGELIAMQTRNARAAAEEVEASERQLLDAHEAMWLGPWYQRAHQWRFRRGFLTELEVPLDTFVEVASSLDPLSDHFAHLQRLHVVEPRASWDHLRLAQQLVALASPLRLHTLVLELTLRDPVMATLASGAFLAHVTTLRLEPIGPAGRAEAFAPLWSSPHLTRVRALEFHEAPMLVDPTLVELAASKRWKQVRRFTHVVRTSRLGPAGVVALVEANPELSHLDLSGHYFLDGAALSAIARTQARLEVLGLGYARLTNAAMPQLARLDALRSLDLRHTRIGDEGLAPILALPNLESLNIAHTLMTAVAARRLVREAPASLKTLTITIPNLEQFLVDQLRRRFQLHRWR